MRKLASGNCNPNPTMISTTPQILQGESAQMICQGVQTDLLRLVLHCLKLETSAVIIGEILCIDENAYSN